ncbi:chloramphenicol O-acetyltransferase type A [Flavobacteriaceae bacterium MAR_2010_105]|nr:chloramphenicol O-acetyltransferase type A [Flavobacteriaceae bacterium MAR_2010_105]
MEIIDIDTWNRKQHYEHFKSLKDPFFGVVIPFDVTNAYKFSKKANISFFGRYLHDCMKAINTNDALKSREKDGKVVRYKVIHASPTILRPDYTFGFSFVKFDDDLNMFLSHLKKEKERVLNSTDLFPPVNGIDCIHCSTLPWFNFSGHKEPVSGENDSVPKIAFSQINNINNKAIMNVSVNVNHAFADGYDIGLFAEKFQHYLNT